MFLAMGASTLLNTSITLITPFIFATSPAMIVNVLFFTQGIGTSGGQSLIGNLANDFGGWKAVTGVLFAIGVLAFLIILKLQIPDSGEVKKAEKKWNPNVKANNIELISKTMDRTIELVKNEQSLPMSQKRKEKYD